MSMTVLCDLLFGRGREGIEEREPRRARPRRPRREIAGKSHRLGPEQARVHGCELRRDRRAEPHPGENVALEVEARRDLDELDAALAQPEHGAFGHVEHALPALLRVAAAEGDLLDRLDELRPLAVAVGREGAAEHHGLGVLADVDEAARADDAAARLTLTLPSRSISAKDRKARSSPPPS